MRRYHTMAAAGCLNLAFRKVFGGTLKKRRFVTVKGEYPYLVRMAGNEVFHVIACMDEACDEEGYREFSVLGAAATVYRGALTLEESPRNNDFWLKDLGTFYEKMSRKGYDREYHARLVSYVYRENNAEDLDRKMGHALQETEKIMLPVLDKAVSPETCLEYLWMMDLIEPAVLEYDESLGTFGESQSEDGLLLVQTDNHDDFRKLSQKLVKRDMQRTGRDYEGLLYERENRRLDIVSQREEIYATPEIYKKALAELGRRKKENQKSLRFCMQNI